MIKLKTIHTSPPFGRQILALHPDSKDTSLAKVMHVVFHRCYNISA